MAKLRVAVVGVGPMGQGHVKHYKGLAGCDLVAVVDQDVDRRGKTAMQYGCQSFADAKDLIGRVDAVSIATPTTSHRDLTCMFLEAGVHCLVEKPMSITPAEAEDMVAAAKKSGRVLQVGHIERFNPAFKAAKAVVNDPRYIVTDRLSPYSFRSRDIGVVLDLMIHDLDIILEFIDDDVANVEAMGIPILSRTEDMCDARLRFRNGALADVRASRVSMKKMRKIRLFQSDGYVTIDYGANQLSIFRKSDEFKSGAIDPETLDPRGLADPFAFVFGKLIAMEQHSLETTDALRDQLQSFAEACRGEHPPVVTGEKGLRAVRLADRIKREADHYIATEAERAGIKLSRPGSGTQPRQGTQGFQEKPTERY